MLDDERHVVAGRPAAACLQQGRGLSPGQVLVHHDLLSCGPLPSLDSLEHWRHVRETYLRSLDVEEPGFLYADTDRDVFANREDLRSASAITVWLGTGLAEQLMFIWVVALLRRLDIDVGRCRLVQFEFDRGHEVIALGALNPSRFKAHPRPVRLEETAIDEATTAWTAVTAPEPDGLLRFLADRKHSLPFLPRALAALLHHYPDLATGLNAWEYQLLRSVRDEGPKAARAVGSTMAHDMEFPEWMADHYLFQRLHRFADNALPKPLLMLSGDTRRLRATEVRVTEHGEAILAGKGNAVDWNGIDEWVGGVHLDSRNGRVWFRTGETLVPSPA
jgi:hypothetical protein